MQITVTKSGGFDGGSEELGPVESETIDDELRAEIEEELQKVRFEEMPTEPPAHTPVNDGYYYAIEVVDGERSNKVKFDQAEMRGLGHLLRLVEKTGSYHSKPLEQA